MCLWVEVIVHVATQAVYVTVVASVKAVRVPYHLWWFAREKNAYSVLFFGLFAVVQTDKRVLANFLEGL